MLSSEGAAAALAADTPAKGSVSEVLPDVGQGDEFDIEFEEVEEGIEVEEEIEVEEDNDEEEVLQQLTPVSEIDHQNDSSQSIEPHRHEEHFQLGSASPGKSAADLLSAGHRVQGYSGNCGFAGLSETRQKEESLVDGTEINKNHDVVASLYDQWRRNNEKTTLSGGEVNAPALNVDFSSKATNTDLYCEKETDQTPGEDSKQLLLRVRPRSLSPATEFSDGSKRLAMICEFFTEGWCIKGNSCKFLHTKDRVDVAGQLKDGIVDTAEKRSEMIDDKVTSIPLIPRSNGGESPRGKSEMQDLPLHKNDPSVISSFSFGRKSMGKEFNVDNHCHYSSPMAKDRSFQGMCSSSSVKAPENLGRTNTSSHMASLEEMTFKRSQFMPNDHDLSISNPTFYRSQYSLRNSDPFQPHKLVEHNQDHHTLRSCTFKQSTPPFCGSDSENVFRSNILGDAQHSAGSRMKIPYDWEPSVPFRPSFLISQRLLSPRSLYDSIRDSIELNNSADGFSKSSFSHQVDSIGCGQGHFNDDPTKGTFSPESSINKHSTQNISAKDSYVSATGMMESVGAQWRNGNTNKQEEKLLISDRVSNVSEPDKIYNKPDLELHSAGSRHKSEAKEESNGLKDDAAVDLKVHGYLQKESRTLKYFHAALVEFVKELLKPTWREGILSKDAHKIIVKKAVDKVLSSLQPQQIPNTSESVKAYLSSSEPKLAKLVELLFAGADHWKTTYLLGNWFSELQ